MFYKEETKDGKTIGECKGKNNQDEKNSAVNANVKLFDSNTR